MHSIVLAAQAIQCGRAEVVLCGGTESMSNAPFLLPRSLRAPGFGHQKLRDSILADGLTDAFDGQHMATTAERLATKYAIDRETQDAYAAQAQARCAAAIHDGIFEQEIVEVAGIVCDEHPRPETTASSLSTLRPRLMKTGRSQQETHRASTTERPFYLLRASPRPKKTHGPCWQSSTTSPKPAVIQKKWDSDRFMRLANWCGEQEYHWSSTMRSRSTKPLPRK